MQPYAVSFIILLLFGVMSCGRNSASVERSMASIQMARAAQERSLSILDKMATQTTNATIDGRIAESAGHEIQRYAVDERKAVLVSQQQLSIAHQELTAYRVGTSKRSRRAVVDDVNRAVVASANAIRILEKKTEVIVDFLNNETFSKSEIGALFPPGDYHLQPQQKQEGERLFKPIVEKLFTFAAKYSESFKTLRGEIIVTGYSDATPVEPNSRLYRNLTQRIQTSDPSSADMNQKLSELRAGAVKELLTHLIAKHTNTGLTIDVTVLGRGEEIPRGLPANIARSDPRRRVVTFYWVVLPTL